VATVWFVPDSNSPRPKVCLFALWTRLFQIPPCPMTARLDTTVSLQTTIRSGQCLVRGTKELASAAAAAAACRTHARRKSVSHPKRRRKLLRVLRKHESIGYTLVPSFNVIMLLDGICNHRINFFGLRLWRGHHSS
jgi:hypothetical protein